MSLCDNCVKGVRHEGTPEGQFQEIDGIKCYVATPVEPFASDKVILFLTDAFGINFLNNQTIAPDLFFGDPIPEDYMSGKVEFSIMDWVAKHSVAVTQPIVDKVVAALRTENVSRIGITGYCFGGRYCFNLAFENVANVVVVSHPSLLKIPDDLQKYAGVSEAPLLINSCTVDQQFPLDAQAKADEIFGNGKFLPGYKREYWDGCTHGFAVRGDLSDPKVKAGKEGAFKAAVLWFKQYL